MKTLFKRSMMVLAVALFSIVPATLPAAEKGSHLTVKNNTNRELLGMMWMDEKVHLNHVGGDWQYGTLSKKGSLKFDVPVCKFSFVMWDGSDLWHFEVHDCNSSTMTINGDDDSYHVKLK